MMLSLMTFTSIICLPPDGCRPYFGPASGLMPQFYHFHSLFNIQFLNWQVRAPWLPDWHRGGRGDGDQLETSAVQVREMNWWAYKLMNSVFREAAKTRYLSQESDCQYFHNIMSEYFLGTFGNGKPKPFKFTEIQRHRFGLKSKDAAEDRQVNSSSSNLWDRIFIFSQRCQTCHLCFPLLRKMSKDSTWGSWAS